MKVLGIVSNCWRVQLEQGAELDRLIDQALAEGYPVIELRQTCLGRYEQGAQHLPEADALASLARRFPDVRFNLALSFPYFSSTATPQAPLFRAGLDAAQAIAGAFPAHLRLVDLETSEQNLATRSVEQLAVSLAELAAPLVRRRGTLSLENARQSWSTLHAALSRARELLGDDAACLRLCYDACNLLHAADQPAPAQAVAGLQAAELAMVHFKQERAGAPQPTVCDGDIDWAQQLAPLAAMQYNGPGLFEILPHDAIWEHLRQSRDYLAEKWEGERP